MTDDLDGESARPPFPLDDGTGPARRISQAQASAMIDAAIAAAAGPPPVARAQAKLAWTLAGISSAIAIVSLSALTWMLVIDRPMPAAPARPASSAPAPEPDPEPVVSPAPGPAADPGPGPRPGPVASLRPGSGPRPVAGSRPGPGPRADLLAEANALRASGEWREAESTYARVSRDSPGTLSSYVADVAAADVRREHLSDPRGAARLYRRAIAARPTGPLDREAREGLALALRAADDRARERAALEELLARHASDRARARLEELAAQSPP